MRREAFGRALGAQAAGTVHAFTTSVARNSVRGDLNGHPSVGGPLIIVSDDSAAMREVLDEVLTSAGYTVRTASSGARALEAMSAQRPDLVITDLLMPGMSGFSLRAAMLRRPDLASIPVIILSGYWQRPGETLDAAAVLTKPLSIDQLLACVRDLVPLDARGSRDENRPAATAVSSEAPRAVESPAPR
jgi:CheY-like chemotaxis protein